MQTTARGEDLEASSPCADLAVVASNARHKKRRKMNISDIASLIRDIPDFPKKGIVFKDIVPILSNGTAFRSSIELLREAMEATGRRYDVVCGLESRGFIFGAPLAAACGLPFVPIRKAGKLPPPVVSQSYTLEYGEATLELSEGIVAPGAEVCIVDDILATGGTMMAAAKLVESCQAKPSFLLTFAELPGLGGRDLLKGYDVKALLEL